MTSASSSSTTALYPAFANTRRRSPTRQTSMSLCLRGIVDALAEVLEEPWHLPTNTLVESTGTRCLSATLF